MSYQDTGQSLLDCLKEISALLEGAYKISLKEQESLVNNDAEKLTISCKAQEEILRRIYEADQRASAISERLAQETGLDLQGANVGAVAEAAGFPYRDLIQQETIRISKTAAQVHEVNQVNAQLLQNGLDIIACCLRTLAMDTGPGTYSKDAGLTEGKPYILSLNRQA